MILSVETLAWRYPGGQGVGPLSFALAQGEAALLLGPSGSGKTTLMNLMAGLRTPQQGRVLLDGRSMGALPAPARDVLRRETLGLIFQTLRLVSALGVRANLALARQLAGLPADAAFADSLLARLNLSHRADALPRTLSQGEAQRAAIARALVTRPRLLVADEPTSALDAANATTVAALLKESAADNGAALLVITHDDRLAAHFHRAIRLGADGLLADAA